MQDIANLGLVWIHQIHQEGRAPPHEGTVVIQRNELIVFSEGDTRLYIYTQ